TCTQECLILGHSDNCWMPPALAPFQPPSTALPSFGFPPAWGRGARPEGRPALTRPLPKDDPDKGLAGPRPPFYAACERHCAGEDPVKVIPLANFVAAHAAPVSGGSATFIHEHQL
ncbi:PCDH9 protein, partial [Crypturellus undulatus]|nr:PCDH9 protein [Crypturellus undulatus]